MHRIWVLFVFAMVFSCGCEKSESNGTAQGNAIAEECKSFLNKSTSAKDRAELDRKIRVAVQTAGDCHVRSEMVRSICNGEFLRLYGQVAECMFLRAANRTIAR